VTTNDAGRGKRTRVPRGTLTPHRIVEESLRILDTEGVDGFSLPKLGRALGADPTAVYRHFASKDDLVLAIADRLIEESLGRLTASECWIDTLHQIVRRQRETYLAHPAAAWLSACRTTRGPAEMRAVDLILASMFAAGFTGAEAALMYRTFGDFTLFWAGGEAALLALPADIQDQDRQAWDTVYRTADRRTYPSIWRVKAALPKVADDDIFESALSVFMSGLEQAAPARCSCPQHRRRRRPRSAAG